MDDLHLGRTDRCWRRGSSLSLQRPTRRFTHLIDGHLDEYAWERAAQINQFERILNNYDAVEWPTHAKMLWDDEYFYFAFTVQMGICGQFYDQEDDKLWEEEVVEVFIDPDGDGKLSGIGRVLPTP